MTGRELEQKHLKERISLERAKEKARKELMERQAAILSIFEEGEPVPHSVQQRLMQEAEKFDNEWRMDGPRFTALAKKQKKERDKWIPEKK